MHKQGMRLGFCFVLFWAMAAAGGAAGVRERSVFIEAEAFQPTNADWEVRRGWGDEIYTPTSGNAVLANNGHGKGEATAHVQIPAEGEYNVWVRYLKIGAYPGAFGLRITQGGKIVFDQAYRTKPEGNDWRAVWEKFPARLQAGPATLTLYIAQPGVRQRIDCVLLTPDLDYQPRHEDFAPQTFVRFRLREPAAAAVAKINLYWHHGPRYYYYAGFVTAAGLSKQPRPEVPPGEWSGWAELTTFLDSGDSLTTVKAAFQSGGRPLSGLKVEWQITRTPEETTPITLTDEQEGHISSLILPGDIRQYSEKIELCSAATARHLAAAQALGLPPLPPIQLDVEAYICGFGDAYDSPRMLAQEMAAAHLLGFNCFNDLFGVRARAAASIGVERGFLSQWMPSVVWKCPTNPGLPEILDKHFAQRAAEIQKEDPEAFPRHRRNKLWDEPGTSDLKHLAECASCRQAFVQYLQQQGFKPEDFGHASWETIRPIERQAATAAPTRRLYYWSIQFRDWTNARLFQLATQAAQKHFGEAIRQTTNFTNAPVSGWSSGLIEGPDWFLFGRLPAVTMLWSEDWTALGPEVSGLIADMLRAAARPHQLPFGEYIIANHIPTLPQRTLAALMHGAKTIHFYCYGPYYAFVDGKISDDPEAQRAIGRLTRFLAQADPYLYPAELPPAEVALLYGKSHEIWQEEAAVATERRSLYLALQHEHIPVDILSEEDISEGQLGGYKVLYMTESNIRRAAAAQIAQWVRAGGVLHMSAGAGLADEYNEPLEELAALAGVRVKEVEKPRGDYREHYGLPLQKSHGEARIDLAALRAIGKGLEQAPAAISFPLLGYEEHTEADGAQAIALFADGRPAAFVRPVGRGYVVRYAFMPGLGYVKSADIKREGLITGHKPEQRWLLTWPVRLAGVVPPLSVSEPLVQARALKSPQGYVLCLANWSGAKLPHLRLLLRGVSEGKSFAISGAPVQQRDTAAGMELTLPLEDIEIVVVSP